jgi:hypothetical protein
MGIQPFAVSGWRWRLLPFDFDERPEAAQLFYFTLHTTPPPDLDNWNKGDPQQSPTSQS